MRETIPRGAATQGYWSTFPELRGLAEQAAETGQSLDYLVANRSSASRSLWARSSGSLSHLPKIKKSSVTP